MGHHKEIWCSNEWMVGSCTTGGRTFAQPFKGFSPSGKVRYGEMYGRVFADTDAAFEAMHAAGYGSRYYRGPSYFIFLRLPPRVRRHIAEHPARRVAIIRAVLPERDRAFWDNMRALMGAEAHDADLVRRARSKRPMVPS
jgi:hypothetical protein